MLIIKLLIGCHFFIAVNNMRKTTHGSALFALLTMALVGCSSGGGGGSSPVVSEANQASIPTFTPTERAQRVGKTELADSFESALAGVAVNQEERDYLQFVDGEYQHFLNLAKGLGLSTDRESLFNFKLDNSGTYDRREKGVVNLKLPVFSNSPVEYNHSVDKRVVGTNQKESAYGLLVYEAFIDDPTFNYPGVDRHAGGEGFASYAGNPTLFSKNVDHLKGTATYQGNTYFAENYIDGLDRVTKGSFSLTANFDNRSITGLLTPDSNRSGLGVTRLEEGKIAIDANDHMSFAGRAVMSQDIKGGYEGKFMGPAAQEVVGRALLVEIDPRTGYEEREIQAAFGGVRK